MKAITKIVFINEEEQKFFGEGPLKLLHAVEKTGSLRSASLSMGMAYTKALKLVENAEKTLGFKLTERVVGGKSGGGSHLTPEGKEWITKYERYCEACKIANAKLYLEFFSEQ